MKMRHKPQWWEFAFMEGPSMKYKAKDKEKENEVEKEDARARIRAKREAAKQHREGGFDCPNDPRIDL